jgi:Mn-dependent DtxR family transcriptional regulator
MPDEDPNEDELHPFDELERSVLYLLTEPDDGQPMWSVDDIGREMESKEPIVAVRGLHRAGLIHKTSDGFVFATRAAVRMVQMVGHVI